MAVYIGARFKRADGYVGREFSYTCSIPDVKVGDFIIVPAGKANEEKVVKVTQINVPRGRIDMRIMPYLRGVIRRATPEEVESA